jgi:hypothetical protein
MAVISAAATSTHWASQNGVDVAALEQLWDQQQPVVAEHISICRFDGDAGDRCAGGGTGDAECLVSGASEGRAT